MIPRGRNEADECALGDHAIPLGKSRVKIFGLDTLAQPEADEVKHFLHLGVALD